MASVSRFSSESLTVPCGCMLSKEAVLSALPPLFGVELAALAGSLGENFLSGWR